VLAYKPNPKDFPPQELSIINNTIKLNRLPLSKTDLLKPWDSADEYLLEYLRQENLLNENHSFLTVNDAYGALSIPLIDYSPAAWGDSYVSFKAIKYNLEQNGHSDEGVRLLDNTRLSTKKYSIILLKIPKSMLLFEEQLRELRNIIDIDTKVICGSMIKHTPARAYRLLQEIIGPTTTSLGRKKSRLAFSSFDPDLKNIPKSAINEFSVEGFDLKISSRPGIFSAGKIDNGSRLLVNNLPESTKSLKVIDLGCGNGILSLAVSRLCPNAAILAVDESYQALACTAENVELNYKTTDRTESPVELLAGVAFDIIPGITCQISDCMNELAGSAYNLILCNPPFHQSQNIGDVVAWNMFLQSRRVLQKGGELRIVANRHLMYHTKLKRLFGNCTVIASDTKFVILSSIKN
jgi:23S rRNA (guanine1835-N2)-methyltransferase